MPMFTKEQKEKLVLALKAYRSSVKKSEAAGNDLNEKLGHLKNALGSTSQGPQLLEEAMRTLGEFYLESLKED